MIGESFINNEDSLLIAIKTDRTVNSFVKGYGVNKSLWKPFKNGRLTTAMEKDKFVDKYTVCVKKNDVIVGHLPHDKNGRFAKMMFYFLRGEKYAEYKVMITGKEVNLSNGEEMQVPCLLMLKIREHFVKIIKINRISQFSFSSNYSTNSLML